MDRLRLRKTETPDGSPMEHWLVADGADVAIVEETGQGEGAPQPLPAGAVHAVLGRYGRPLEAPMPPLAADDAAIAVALPSGGWGTLRAFQFRAPVDVIANDYLVLESDGAEPLCAPAPLVVQALLALARAMAALTPED